MVLDKDSRVIDVDVGWVQSVFLRTGRLLVDITKWVRIIHVKRKCLTNPMWSSLKNVPIIFWISLLAILFLLLWIAFQETTKDSLLDTEGLALQVREKVGWPSELIYKEALSSSDFENEVKRDLYGKVFVCMTAMPNRLAMVHQSFASVPDHFVKVLVLPNEFRNRTDAK